MPASAAAASYAFGIAWLFVAPSVTPASSAPRARSGPGNRTPRSSQRTNGVVVPPAGSVAAPAGHPGRGRCGPPPRGPRREARSVARPDASSERGHDLFQASRGRRRVSVRIEAQRLADDELDVAPPPAAGTGGGRHGVGGGGGGRPRPRSTAASATRAAGARG